MMPRACLLIAAALFAAPPAIADMPACGLELDRATTVAREAKSRLERASREAYEMIGWISMDYEEGLIDAEEEARLLTEAEEKHRAAEAEHAEAAERLAALRAKLIECNAADA
jgi:hypothetical protein